MHPPIRSQTDDLQEQYSIATALDCSNLPGLTRQEFKDDTDVNKVLARYGVGGLQQRPVQYSEVDYDMDLQRSLESIREAERAIAKLPPKLRSKYGTWEQLLDGVSNGALKLDLAVYHDELKAVAEATAEAEKKIIDRQEAVPEKRPPLDGVAA